MKNKTTVSKHHVVEVKGCPKVVVEAGIFSQFKLKYKMLAVSTALGFTAYAVSLP